MKLIALVGKPNVGKSTLFNRLVGRRQAIVGPLSGLTRDRNIAQVERRGYRYLLMDTGGFEPEVKEGIRAKMKEQSQLAVEEADIILFVLDRLSGLTEQDKDIYHYLVQSGKPVYLVINKVDGESHEAGIGEFYELGAREIFTVSAEHGRGVNDLFDRLVEDHPDLAGDPVEEEEERISIALLGRPNAGKSSLANAFLGHNKQIVDDEPGTTRDPVDNDFTFYGQKLKLIDTAGLKRKARVSLQVDHYSMVGAIRSIERCDVGILVIDGTAGVVEQDARIGGYIEEAGKGVVIVVNKWDLVPKDSKTMQKMEEEIRAELQFLSFAPILFVSAKEGQRVPKVLEAAIRVFESCRKRVKTADCNKVLAEITVRHSPPGKAGRKTRLYYASQVAIRPPTFVVHTNDPDTIVESYRRYMVQQLRHYFGFEGTPIRVLWRDKNKKKEGEEE